MQKIITVAMFTNAKAASCAADTPHLIEHPGFLSQSGLNGKAIYYSIDVINAENPH
jgi:hypothetical protein